MCPLGELPVGPVEGSDFVLAYAARVLVDIAGRD